MKKFVYMVLVMGMPLFAGDIIIKESSCSVNQTIENIKQIVKGKGLGVFAIINHQGNANAVGMKLRESKMIIFGNPKVGTKLMQEDITVGLDLPLRILVYKGADGRTKVAYRNASWLQEHHILHKPQLISKVDTALDKITTKAGQCKKD